jgi:hypothetical protein
MGFLSFPWPELDAPRCPRIDERAPGVTRIPPVGTSPVSGPPVQSVDAGRAGAGQPDAEPPGEPLRLAGRVEGCPGRAGAASGLE